MPTIITASVASSRATLPVNIVTIFCSTPSIFAVCARAGSASPTLRTSRCKEARGGFLETRGHVKASYECCGRTGPDRAFGWRFSKQVFLIVHRQRLRCRDLRDRRPSLGAPCRDRHWRRGRQRVRRQEVARAGYVTPARAL